MLINGFCYNEILVRRAERSFEGDRYLTEFHLFGRHFQRETIVKLNLYSIVVKRFEMSDVVDNRLPVDRLGFVVEQVGRAIRFVVKRIDHWIRLERIVMLFLL